MLRAIIGVIVGFITMAVLVMVGFAAVYSALGADRVFQEGAWAVTGQWISLTSGVGLIAAIAGGVLCAVIAQRGSMAPAALIVVIVVLGVGEAAYKHGVVYKGELPPREDEITMAQATNNAREPLYVSLLNPVIGAVGVFLGSRLTGRSSKPAVSERHLPAAAQRRVSRHGGT